MIEELIRHELPIQSIVERHQDCYAIVPIHLSVLNLPDIVKADLRMIEGAKETVAKWYNEDMEYYLDVLGSQRKHTFHLKGYEKFDESWRLDAIPGKGGFLTLRWQEKNAQHILQYLRIPLILYNQTDENRQFYNYETFRKKREVEIFYKHIHDSEVVYFTPEKMLKYGKKSRLTGFKPKSGIIEVSSRCLISNYTPNFAHALLLRDFGMFYHNRLLEAAQRKE